MSKSGDFYCFSKKYGECFENFHKKTVFVEVALGFFFLGSPVGEISPKKKTLARVEE